MTESLNEFVGWAVPTIMASGGHCPPYFDKNIQMSMAPVERPAQYFAVAAAVTGVSGGLGAAAGGFLAGLDIIGGLLGLFALSAVLRLIALLPLVFVQEPRSQPVVQVLRNLFRFQPQPALVTAVEIADPAD